MRLVRTNPAADNYRAFVNSQEVPWGSPGREAYRLNTDVYLPEVTVAREVWNAATAALRG